VPPGSSFSDDQRLALAAVIASAERVSGMPFRLYVGELSGGRAQAEALLAALGASAADTVLVAIDPGSRRLEIVTGPRAAQSLDDRTCALGALAMTSSFEADDLVGGIRNGVQLLADHSRHPARRHVSTF